MINIGPYSIAVSPLMRFSERSNPSWPKVVKHVWSFFSPPKEREVLESWQRSTTIRVGLTRRGRIILLLCDGVPVSQSARMVGVARGPVYKWAKRFQKHRLCGLEDKAGRGKEPFFPSRSGSASCEDSLRGARAQGKIPLAVGFQGVVEEARRRWNRREHLD